MHDCKYDISDKTYIPLQETIDLCDQKLFEAKNNIDGLSQDSFREILTVIKTENFFILKQIKHFVSNILLQKSYAHLFIGARVISAILLITLKLTNFF